MTKEEFDGIRIRYNAKTIYDPVTNIPVGIWYYCPYGQAPDPAKGAPVIVDLFAATPVSIPLPAGKNGWEQMTRLFPPQSWLTDN